MKKIPYRKCVVSNERYPKDELVRIVRTPEKEVKVDFSGKLNGKGAYLYPSKEIIEKARKNKALNKALETEIPDEIYEKLLSMIK